MVKEYDLTHETTKDTELEEIAVVGMAARFPGADDIDQFWRNLRDGVESITSFSDEELAHVSPALLKKPNYVKSGAVLDGIDLFDAAFFKLTPREAAMMDPQQRLFLETCWHALEHAGYAPETHGKATGVFAGAGAGYYLHRLLRDPALIESLGEMQLGIGNGPDHFTPRVSYLLNLGGPSIPVQTACSTSLVAVHLACQSLINYECDLALAGGCSVQVPARNGYLYMEDGILSPDGHCRPFDAEAKGTIRGSGSGAVALKRLSDALADGDRIYAVIEGSAVNNDGAAKMGYTAPSVEGQRRVIQEALAVGEIDPATISYVEAHGTATAMGDPIEIEALAQAFATSASTASCAIGSVKSNIGHCDAAAGIAGFLKTVLCLEHKTLAPSLHFEKANPKIDFDALPFYVQTETRAWDAPERRAGVSSFGIGGTNAHVILREPPPREQTPKPEPYRLVTLSAMTETALATKKSSWLCFWSKTRKPRSTTSPLRSIRVGRRCPSAAPWWSKTIRSRISRNC